MCYNPQKSYQPGWYSDKTKSIYPLDGKYGENNFNFVLIGVSDYIINSDENGLIALRLEQTSREQDYYVGFNRDVGITEDIWEDANIVTIVRKEWGAPDEYGQSTKIASLTPGEKHVIKNFNGKQRTVETTFDSLENGIAKIVVTGGDDMPCKNEAKKRFAVREHGPERKCKVWAKRNKCDMRTYMGDFVWERCERACDRC
jgi:hypothetical protein